MLTQKLPNSQYNYIFLEEVKYFWENYLHAYLSFFQLDITLFFQLHTLGIIHKLSTSQVKYYWISDYGGSTGQLHYC